jgi:hypothetical protein
MLPCSCSFLDPPDPPDVCELDGGSSGITSVMSAASRVVIVSSLGRGTGERSGFNIVQLSAIVVEKGESL